MTPPRVSVVIINFNSGRYIFRCLKQVRAQNYPDIEILVVDNASSDGSSQTLAAMGERGEIRYHRSEENQGSSKANNFGIRSTTGEFVLILNADAFLDEGYIQRCVTAFQRDPSIGTVIGKLVSTHDRSIIDCVGIRLFREGIAADRGMRQKDRGQFDKPEFVAGACCAAALYKREMLEAVRFGEEYYDEDFFAFYEDVDLSVRALLLGWKTLYLPDAVAQHVRGAWKKDGSPFIEFLGVRNQGFFFLKTFRSGDPLEMILRAMLDFARTFTEAGALKREYRDRYAADMARIGRKLEEKRRALAPAVDYARLKPFCRESYIGHSIAHRLRTAFRRV